jgi:hypothetical protein
MNAPHGPSSPVELTLVEPELPGFEPAASAALTLRWTVLHEAAGLVAGLAGLAPAPLTAAQQRFPEAIRAEGGWRCQLAEQGIADLNAVLVPGLSALLAASERQAPIVPAALALWSEFTTARDAVLGLLPSD